MLWASLLLRVLAIVWGWALRFSPGVMLIIAVASDLNAARGDVVPAVEVINKGGMSVFTTIFGPENEVSVL